MKFKIICVVIIAAALSAILGMALLQKDTPAPVTPVGQPAPVAAQSVVPDTPPVAAPALAQAQVPAETVPAEPAQKDPNTPEESTTTLLEQREMLDTSLIPDTGKGMRLLLSERKERPKVFETALADGAMFSRLSTGQKVNVISNALNLNEEQEVMLASYLENWENLQNEYAGRALIKVPRAMPGPRVGPMAVENVQLDTKLAELEIVVQEIKEVRGLREQFYGAMTKQQKEKFDALPVKSFF